MKKLIMGALTLLSLSQFGIADDAKLAKLESDQLLGSKFDRYYVVHGGCRAYSNNTKLTEIWLYLSHIRNAAYSSTNMRVTMFLEADSKKVYPSIICNCLRTSMMYQLPVHMVLEPRSQSDSIVVSFNQTDVTKFLALAPDLTYRSELLENFSERVRGEK